MLMFYLFLIGCKQTRNPKKNTSSFINKISNLYIKNQIIQLVALTFMISNGHVRSHIFKTGEKKSCFVEEVTNKPETTKLFSGVVVYTKQTLIINFSIFPLSYFSIYLCFYNKFLFNFISNR